MGKVHQVLTVGLCVADVPTLRKVLSRPQPRCFRPGNIEGLDAQPVADQEYLVAFRVGDGVSEHAREVIDEVVAHF